MEPSSRPLDPKQPRQADLSLLARVTLLVAGWLLFLIGLAGLFLPGIQGLLCLALSLAFLSAGSHRAHAFLRRVFQRWPRAWAKIESWRHRVHGWFEAKKD